MSPRSGRGRPAIPSSSETLVLDEVSDLPLLEQAHAAGRPVIVRADTADRIKAAARPEVACVLVPPSARHLLELDLPKLTYG